MRILLADGQPRVRFAMRVLLERQPGVEVVGEAVDAEDLLAQAEMAWRRLICYLRSARLAPIYS